MKELKKVLAIMMCAAMVIPMFTCGVSAAETSTEEAEVSSEEAGSTADDTAGTEIPDEPEIIHIADGEELPDYFYVVPKEQIEAKGEFSLEALYAYIAIEVKENYLDANGLPVEEFYAKYNDVDLLTIKSDYNMAINEFDEFSYSLDKTLEVYDKEFYIEGDELVSCVMRAIFVYCETVGYDRANYLDSDLPIYDVFELSAQKITFSEDQLHYFDD